MNYAYLTVFVLYLAVVLLVGVWGRSRETYDRYIVAGGKLGRTLSAGTFFASYISSATVIGYLGYTTLNGAAIIPTYLWGSALAWIALSLVAAKMKSLNLRSVPALFEARHNSPHLRTFSAAVVIVAFTFGVMTQLVAGSLILAEIIGIPRVLSIVLLSSVLTLYTVLGGLVSVVRTDLVQGALLLTGVLVALGSVAAAAGDDLFRIQPDQSQLFSGQVATPASVIAFILIAGGGVASQPYYLHRFFATKNTSVARLMVGVGSLLITVTMIATVFSGMALPKLLPQEQLGDAALLTFISGKGGVIAAIILIGLICAVQSTVDSALHLAGVYFAEDIVIRVRPRMSETTRLKIGRVATVTVGVITMTGSIYFVVGGGSFVVTLLNIWLGTLSSALLVPLYLSLYWRRLSPAGALWSSVGGFFSYFAALVATEYTTLTVPGHPVFYGFGISFAVAIVVSFVTTPVPDAEMNVKFFRGKMSSRSEGRVSS